MDLNEETEGKGSDLSPAISLEVSSVTARKIDELLQVFAEDAGLTSVIVVDRSGSIVTGISAESEVTMDVISALVAGASGAMRTLINELGDSGEIESLHQSRDQLVYLCEVADRFILAGLSDASQPVGLVRLKAQQIKDDLVDLLSEVVPTEVPVPKPSRSLRAISLERAAARTAETEPMVEAKKEIVEGSVFEIEDLEEPPIDDVEESLPEEVEEPAFQCAEEEFPEEESVVSVQQLDPVEILEPLDDDDLEIIIEDGDDSLLKIDHSVSESEVDENRATSEPAKPQIKASKPVESIFELELEDDDEEYDTEEDEVVADSEPVGEVELEEIPDLAPAVAEEPPVFEFDDEDEDEDEDERDDEVFEPVGLDEDVDFEAVPGSSPECQGSEEEEESGSARSSGPFYF